MVQCQACQAELTEQDLNWGSCPKCGIAVSRAGRGTLVTPVHPDDIRSSGVTEVTEVEAVPDQGNAMDSQGTMEPFLVGEASTPEPTAVPDVSAEDILEAPNTRMSINTNDLPLPVRHKVTSMMFGEDTEGGRSIAESLDLNQDLDADEPTQRSMYDQSNAETNVIEVKDDESGSTWQGIPGKGAESNLHIQDRSVIKDNRDGNARTDYQLIEMIGKGGMGTVWKAKQYSIGRDVAVKMIKPEKALNKESRERFLSEAVVTGDLDHPNIVPIHDLGRFESNELFYSMRRVTGMPWDKILLEKSLEENLDIWTKMADAIAFAHSRGVIHRDIKPENVMVGEFGEVLVMDWGLALPLPNFRRRSIINAPTASGGSPAYMAPEMIGLRLDRVGPWSDIYLLGATLYEIATEQPPHPGRTVSECISNARDNVILPYHKSGMRQELVQIALKAMATDPKDRYETVKDLQEAVKLFEERQESIKLADNAEVAKNRGKEFEEYGEFARSVFGFEEAINRWDGNEIAKSGLDEAKLAYAECALKKNDFDLGISLLQPRNPAHAPMIQKLKDGKQNRDKQAASIKRQRRIVTGLAAMMLIGAFGALAAISYQLKQTQIAKDAADKNAKDALDQKKIAEAKTIEADAAAKDALKQKGIAETKKKEADDAAADALKQKGIAEAKKKEADDAAADALKQKGIAEAKKKEADDATADALKQKGIAEKQTVEAKKQKDLADDQRKLAEEAGFRNTLLLTKTQIEQNNFNAASENLDALRGDSYKALRMANPEYQRGVDQLAEFLDRRGEVVPGDTAFQAIAVSKQGIFATGARDGRIQFWTSAGKPADALPAIVHRNPKDANKGDFSPITGLSFSPDGKLLASSGESIYVRIWNVATHEQVAELKHDDHVQSVHFAPEGDLLATTTKFSPASKEAPVVLWTLNGNAGKRVGEGRGHTGDVNAGAWTSDGAFLITGGVDGVKIWKRDGNKLSQAGTTAEQRDVRAVAVSKSGMVASGGEDKRVVLWSISDAVKAAASKAASFPTETLQHHNGAVRGLAFSPAGDLLVSAAEDNTLCVWITSPAGLKVTVRGHGNAVTDCVFIPGSQKLVSASADSTARIWDLEKYKELDSEKLRQLLSKSMIINSTVAHQSDVRAVALDSTGTRAVTAADDRTAVLWNTVTGDSLMIFQDGQKNLTDKTILLENDTRLLTAGQDQMACLWDVQRGVQLNRLERRGIAGAIAASADQRWLATSGTDDELWLWDMPEFLKGTRLTEPAFKLKVGGTVVGLSFSADNQYVAAATAEPTMVVICGLAEKNVNKKPVPAVNSDNDVEVSGIAYLASGQVLTADSDGKVKFWKVTDGKPELSQDLKADTEPLVGMSISKDGKHLAVISNPDERQPLKGQVSVWNLETKTEVVRIAQLEAVGTVTAVSISADGQQVATASRKEADGTKYVQRWSVDQKEAPLALDLPKQGDAVLAVQLAADGRLLLAQGDEVSLWQWKGKEAVQYYRTQRVTAAALAGDASVVITGGVDGSLKVWDSSTGQCLARIAAHTEEVSSLMFSPKNNSDMVSASADKTVHIWTWNAADKTLTLKKSLEGRHTAPVSRARYSADGSHIVTGGEDGRVCLWNAAGEFKKEYIYTGGKDQKPLVVVSVDAINDGSLVVVADETSYQLIDFSAAMPTVLLEKPVSGHGREQTDVRFVSEGPMVNGRPASLQLLTSSLDGTGKIWDLSAYGSKYSATELRTLGKPGRSSGVSSLAVTNNGTAIVTGHKDGSRRIWRSPVVN